MLDKFSVFIHEKHPHYLWSKGCCRILDLRFKSTRLNSFEIPAWLRCNYSFAFIRTNVRKYLTLTRTICFFSLSHTLIYFGKESGVHAFGRSIIKFIFFLLGPKTMTSGYLPICAILYFFP